MGKVGILVTGANGEVGHTLLPELNKLQKYDIFAIDIADLDPSLTSHVKKFYQGTVLNRRLVASIINNEKIEIVFHLAAILSTAAEKNPEKASAVNVGGTSVVLEATNNKAQKEKKPIRFIFPSTIAVYGLPDVETKVKTPPLKENEFLNPITMYGINKLYCEALGGYYSNYYKSLELKPKERFLDFRCVRFPGLISALTVPTGGTSDYAPEMIHTAAQGISYESFVRVDTILPFMAMPDAAKALIGLAETPKNKLTRQIYNVTSFSAKTEDIANIVLNVFPNTAISYNPDKGRQRIVDSWPAAVDDVVARRDWNWQPDYDMQKTFRNYLIPEVQNRYK